MRARAYVCIIIHSTNENQGNKKGSILSFRSNEKPWAPEHLYSAPIAGSVGHPGAYNKWCVMERHDRARSQWDQACARLRPATLRCTNLAIATQQDN